MISRKDFGFGNVFLFFFCFFLFRVFFLGNGHDCQEIGLDAKFLLRVLFTREERKD